MSEEQSKSDKGVLLLEKATELGLLENEGDRVVMCVGTSLPTAGGVYLHDDCARATNAPLPTHSKEELELSDGVWARVVQVIQEGIILGQDVVDILRLVRVQHDEINPNVLVLSPAYEVRVKEMHARLVEEAQKISNLTSVAKN